MEKDCLRGREIRMPFGVMRWIPLFSSLLIDLMLVSYLLEDYPQAMNHKERSYAPEHTERHVLKISGPNISSIDAQIASLSLAGRPICVDYRTLNRTLVTVDHDQSSAHQSQSDDRGRGDFKVGVRAEDVRDVRKFVFFVGYPRSGHSIVGSMMDAHPNMVIAHEYNLFPQWGEAPSKHSQRMYLYNALFKNSVDNAVSGWRSLQKDGKGYTLGIEHQWQADFEKLLVIGDKSGAITTQLFASDPDRFMTILAELKRTVRVPIRVIHVVRNPYDIITTRLLYADAGKKSKFNATEERKHCNDYGLHYHTNRTFSMMNSVQSLMKRTDLTVLDVHLADLVRHPRDTLKMICRFLNLACAEDYLDACERKVFAKLSKTRLLVHWPQVLVEDVHRLARPYRFLWRYTFDGD